MAVGNNFWMNQSPWLPTAQGGGEQGGGGYGGDTQSISYRDPIDASRSGAYTRQGAAEYPDGYIDDARERRENRLAKDIMGRLTDRNYQRGVHAGVKMAPEQYFWPAEFSAESRMIAEARGRSVGNVIMVERMAPVGSPELTLMHGGRVGQLNDQDRSKVMGMLGIDPGAYADPEIPVPGQKSPIPWSW